jgi:hypothetical protein
MNGLSKLVFIALMPGLDAFSPHHLYWPDLDIDLAVESIEHPERYPLVSRARPNERLQPTKARRKPKAKRAARKTRG